MTPKEKAEKLVDKMLSKNPNRQDGISSIDFIQAKLCALIAVDEIIKAPHDSHYYAGFIPEDGEPTDFFWDEFENFWNQVKQEIENI